MKITTLILLLVLLSASLAYSQEELKTYTQVGQKMPDFSITDLDNKEFKLSDLKGKVVVVFLWATWCPYCQSEMPHLEKEIWQKYKSEDFAMIAIAREETESLISEFRKKTEFSFPLAADPKNEVFRLFANRGVPRSYVVDRNGKILFQSIGLETETFAERKRIIEKELGKIKKEKAGK